LEAEVLQRLRRPPVEPGRFGVVAATSGEVTKRDPGSRTVACRAELLEAHIGTAQNFFSLVQAILLQQSAAQHELGVPDLVQVVHPAVEQVERLPSLALCL